MIEKNYCPTSVLYLAEILDSCSSLVYRNAVRTHKVVTPSIAVCITPQLPSSSMENYFFFPHTIKKYNSVFLILHESLAVTLSHNSLFQCKNCAYVACRLTHKTSHLLWCESLQWGYSHSSKWGELGFTYRGSTEIMTVLHWVWLLHSWGKL